jgi:Subtilisin inhibitor-like
MSRARLLSVMAAIALACGLGGLAAPPASATATSFGNLALQLSDPNTGRVLRQVTLSCLPTGGTHPDAQAACNDLINAYGNINNIPPEQGVFCPAIFLPVTATAAGTWGGLRISYGRTFSNSCFASVLTGGHVFHF